MEPGLRSELASAAYNISKIAGVAHQRVFDLEMRWQNGRFTPVSPQFKDFSLFGLYRSFFWEEARQHLAALAKETSPQSAKSRQILERWLATARNMNFLIILTMLPLGVRRPKNNWHDGDTLPRPDANFAELAPLLEAQIYDY